MMNKYDTNNNFIIVITTLPNGKKAKKLANSILKSKLAACIQLSKISSLYVWNNNIEHTKEIKLTIKTKKSLYKDLELHITKLHPYDIPEIIMIDIDDGNSAYLDWIELNTNFR